MGDEVDPFQASSIADAVSNSSLAGTADASMDPAANASSGTLSFVQRLVPPMKRVGEGANALQYPPQSPVWSIDFSRDGKWLAAAFGAPDPCVRLWKKQPSNDNTDASLWVLHSTLSGIHDRTIRSLAFCPLSNPCILAVASFDASVTIWEYSSDSNTTGKPTPSATKEVWDCTTQLEGHDHEIKDVTWNATGSLLATCGRDKT